MKRILGILFVLMLGAAFAPAQTIVPAQLQYTWATPTATGQLGNYIVLNGLTAPRPSNYTIDWSISGSAPSVCTFNAQGSSDNVNWFALDGGTAVSCTSSNFESVTAKPVLYLRIDIASWTSGGGTIAFHYTGGR